MRNVRFLAFVPVVAAALSTLACNTTPAPLDHDPVDAPTLAPADTTPCPGEDADTAAIHASISRARAMAGVAPLRCDAAASAATQHHCKYVVANHEITHVETPGHPEFTGVSFEDRLAAQSFADVPSAEILTSISGPDAIDGRYGMLNTVYHRSPILRPYNSSFGLSLEAGCVTVDFGKPVGSDDTGADVIWPPDGATHVSTYFVSKYESPNPVPGSEMVGSPVSLLTTGHLEQIDATMTAADGTKIDAVLITFASDPAKLVHKGDVHLVPRAPLSPQTKYTVHFHAEDVDAHREIDRSTTFTTGDE
jgi:uncharacterized protein YkwD